MVYLFITIILLLLPFSRVIFLLYKVRFHKTSIPSRLKPVKTTIIMGSGGHTAEMLRLVKNINLLNYNPRLYVIASTDKGSEAKVMSLESETGRSKESGSYDIIKIPRSRHVSQSYLSSVFSTLYSVLHCIPLVYREKPELILCNGPGTCVPICAIAFCMKAFWVCDTKIVFIESICRVRTLSLTGKLLLHFADEFIVQWKDLHDLYQNTKYMGCLV
ncbi:UDP-N-acetylglucosamine transferase subunit ALG14 [Hetaerina americana]|uniref:UDP-N-acetylglucosamine transferase subunit ALG14 n=1 Tax=Hetaerina americana TaxID=62018 RepID=UPI003A7F18D3